MMCNFENKVLRTLETYSMVRQNDRVLVGLSGGKDSVSLLYFLSKHQKELAIRVAAFHLNHGIRGAEADRDDAFSEAFAERLGVPFFRSFLDVPAFARKRRIGLEEAARICRYQAFQTICESRSFDKTATAHTASDNTETVILNLMRGSGGIVGIPPVRGNIIRPLIECTAEEVIEYCRENGLAYLYDTSNSDNEFKRNRIRNEVLPALKGMNPSIDSAVSRSAYISACNRRLFDALAEEFLVNHAVLGRIDLPKLRELAADEKNLSVLHRVLNRLAKPLGAFADYDTLIRARDLILGGQTGKKIPLPGGAELAIRYESAEITKTGEKNLYSGFHIPIKLGWNPVPNSVFALLFSKTGDTPSIRDDNFIIYRNINKIAKNIFLDSSIIKCDLYMRNRKVSDSYRTGGMTKSVKKHLINQKVERDRREFFPVVCDKEGIVWVPGLPVCDRMKENDRAYTMSLWIQTQS